MKTFTMANGHKVVIKDDVDTTTIDPDGHTRLFARLAAITNMHNPPGPRKGKAGKR